MKRFPSFPNIPKSKSARNVQIVLAEYQAEILCQSFTAASFVRGGFAVPREYKGRAFATLHMRSLYFPKARNLVLDLCFNQLDFLVFDPRSKMFISYHIHLSYVCVIHTDAHTNTTNKHPHAKHIHALSHMHISVYFSLKRRRAKAEREE